MCMPFVFSICGVTCICVVYVVSTQAYGVQYCRMWLSTIDQSYAVVINCVIALSVAHCCVGYVTQRYWCFTLTFVAISSMSCGYRYSLCV